MEHYNTKKRYCPHQIQTKIKSVELFRQTHDVDYVIRRYHISKLNRKPSQIKKLSASGQYAAKKSEHKKSSIRAKVEHVFAVVKRQLGYRRTRY